MAVIVSSYVAIEAQLYTDTVMRQMCLPMDSRSEHGNTVYFGYLTAMTILALGLCIPTFVRAYMVRDVEKNSIRF